ncbi:MAG: 4-alpha-glucanotransferase [Gammaproteobacteria bacterium]|nr:4-alpha-glucanotransferase [Gammaproteobacteria bacterium]
MANPNLQQRRAGILLHPTSLPSGILDSDVERWLQMMSDTGFSVWQVLPLGEPQSGLSPYQCSSAFAFNPLLLPEISEVDQCDKDFIDFCNKQTFWLNDYVLFKVLKQHFNDVSWVEWPDKWKFRDAETLQQSCQQFEKNITELKWQQYQLDKRWHEIKLKASAMGILLFGDMPIFIGHDSADVWAHPEWFLLDSNGNMKVVSGVPPDYFSATGQRWGNPHYDWKAMQEDDYTWWKSRIHHHLEQFDLVRIDHFRGLEAAWVIDASCETAVEGNWQKMPGDELLSSIKSSLDKCYNRLPFVAEDLGIITPEVTALKNKYQLPGMSILQFGFDEFEDNPHKPKNIKEDTVVYTGTHDNDTTKGWFNSLEAHVKEHVLRVLDLPLDDSAGVDDQDTEVSSCWYDNINVADLVVEKMVDNAMYSAANICIIPIQDCLHLGTDARMNTPGTITGNWQWQLQWQQIENQHDSSRMKKMLMRNESANRLVEPN